MRSTDHTSSPDSRSISLLDKIRGKGSTSAGAARISSYSSPSSPSQATATGSASNPQPAVAEPARFRYNYNYNYNLDDSDDSDCVSPTQQRPGFQITHQPDRPRLPARAPSDDEACLQDIRGWQARAGDGSVASSRTVRRKKSSPGQTHEEVRSSPGSSESTDGDDGMWRESRLLSRSRAQIGVAVSHDDGDGDDDESEYEDDLVYSSDEGEPDRVPPVPALPLPVQQHNQHQQQEHHQHQQHQHITDPPPRGTSPRQWFYDAAKAAESDDSASPTSPIRDNKDVVPKKDANPADLATVGFLPSSRYQQPSTLQKQNAQQQQQQQQPQKQKQQPAQHSGKNNKRKNNFPSPSPSPSPSPVPSFRYSTEPEVCEAARVDVAARQAMQAPPPQQQQQQQDQEQVDKNQLHRMDYWKRGICPQYTCLRPFPVSAANGGPPSTCPHCGFDLDSCRYYKGREIYKLDRGLEQQQRQQHQQHHAVDDDRGVREGEDATHEPKTEGQEELERRATPEWGFSVHGHARPPYTYDDIVGRKVATPIGSSHRTPPPLLRERRGLLPPTLGRSPKQAAGPERGDLRQLYEDHQLKQQQEQFSPSRAPPVPSSGLVGRNSSANGTGPPAGTRLSSSSSSLSWSFMPERPASAAAGSTALKTAEAAANTSRFFRHSNGNRSSGTSAGSGWTPSATTTTPTTPTPTPTTTNTNTNTNTNTPASSAGTTALGRFIRRIDKNLAVATNTGRRTHGDRKRPPVPTPPRHSSLLRLPFGNGEQSPSPTAATHVTTGAAAAGADAKARKADMMTGPRSNDNNSNNNNNSYPSPPRLSGDEVAREMGCALPILELRRRVESGGTLDAFDCIRALEQEGPQWHHQQPQRQGRDEGRDENVAGGGDGRMGMADEAREEREERGAVPAFHQWMTPEQYAEFERAEREKGSDADLFMDIYRRYERETRYYGGEA